VGLVAAVWGHLSTQNGFLLPQHILHQEPSDYAIAGILSVRTDDGHFTPSRASVAP
jgi:hypothetical protein